jgi:peptidoglycan/xylan/chitin deacetylase (PgdA/CDA1 family)
MFNNFFRKTKPVKCKTIVLMYHRVTPDAIDPALLKVSSAFFREQILEIKRNYEIIPLRTINEPSEHKFRCVITFDDGYEDNFTYATPILKELGVPATIFVTSGYIHNPREFWWDGLNRIFIQPRKLPDTLHINVEETPLTFDKLLDPEDLTHWNVLNSDSATPRIKAYRDLAKRLKSMPFEARERVMDQLCHWAQIPTPQDHSTIMSEKMIEELAAGGLIEIGGHTMTHPQLATLNSTESLRELCECKRILDKITKTETTSFAYPFGGRNDYNAQTVEHVKKAGFHRACSNFQGVNSLPTNTFEIPRYMVLNWRGKTLLDNLKTWFN